MGIFNIRNRICRKEIEYLIFKRIQKINQRFQKGLLLYLILTGQRKNTWGAKIWHTLPKNIGEYHGLHATPQGPLFTYQYYHCFFDLRNRNDGWCNWFENSINATLANRMYCYKEMNNHKTFDIDIWGITACDHPEGYFAWGTPPGYSNTNGTIAPTAAGASIMFTPELSIRELGTSTGENAWNKEQRFHIDNKILKIGKNVIAVKVIDNGGEGGIWKRPVYLGKYYEIHFDPFN